MYGLRPSLELLYGHLDRLTDQVRAAGNLSGIRLDAPAPFIDVRAETTKSKKAAVIPLVPQLAMEMRSRHANARHFSGKVFPHGIPSAQTLAKDLAACHIPVEDGRGYRVDFHALRHTFASLLATAGVSELARVKLARHSEWKQTDRYTDPNSLPLFTEIQKLAAGFPSSIASPMASPKFGKTRPKKGKAGKTLSSESEAEIVAIDDDRAPLGKAVPSWDKGSMVPRGGLEGPENESEAVESKGESASEKPPVSLGASQNSEQLCSELSEVVSSWPKLSPEIRRAFLMFLRTARRGE